MMQTIVWLSFIVVVTPGLYSFCCIIILSHYSDAINLLCLIILELDLEPLICHVPGSSPCLFLV